MLTAPVQPTAASVEARVRKLGRFAADRVAQAAKKRVEAILLGAPFIHPRHLPMHIQTVRTCADAACNPVPTDDDTDVTYAAWVAVQFSVRIAFDVAEARSPGTGAAAEAAAWAAADQDLAPFCGGARV